MKDNRCPIGTGAYFFHDKIFILYIHGFYSWYIYIYVSINASISISIWLLYMFCLLTDRYGDICMLDPVWHMYMWLKDNGPLPRRRGLTSFKIYVYSRPCQQAIAYIWLKDNCPPSTTTIYIYYTIISILSYTLWWCD